MAIGAVQSNRLESVRKSDLGRPSWGCSSSFGTKTRLARCLRLFKDRQLPAAGRAKSRVRRTERFATGTLKVRTLVSVPDDQVSDIWDPREGVREDENRVPLVDGIYK